MYAVATNTQRGNTVERVAQVYVSHNIIDEAAQSAAGGEWRCRLTYHITYYKAVTN